MLARPLDQSRSIAALVTRAQPCDAGWAGIEPAPWMAMPPLKYLGRYRVPRGAWRSPSISRSTAKDPTGVVATAVPPLGAASASPLPVEVFRGLGRASRGGRGVWDCLNLGGAG